MHRSLLACAVVLVLVACSPAPTPAVASSHGGGGMCTADSAAPVTTVAIAPTPPIAAPAEPAALDAGSPASAASPASEAGAPPPASSPAIGAAQGGPKGVHPCEFHESVDTYNRTCTVKTNADGSLTITAPGTALNPKNGFELRMGGGPERFTASGQLDAFGICKGPFSGPMIAIHDGAKKTYEVRFREHCMIVIR